MIRRICCILGALTLLLPRPSQAYMCRTSVTDPCHEEMTIAAFAGIGEQERLLLNGALDSPPIGTWEQIEGELFGDLLSAQSAEHAWSAREHFFLFSLLLGVRYPDSFGRSVSDLNALRRVHSDPDPWVQAAHCLRAPEDDGPEGDSAALERSQLLLATLAESALESLAARPTSLTVTRVSLDTIGALDTEVLTAAFQLGQALHLLQDSYSHTVRTPDGAKVLSVLNYVDALSGHSVPERDGALHAGGMDACRSPNVAPLVARATAASIALLEAAIAGSAGNRGPLVAGFAACAGSARPDCGFLERDAACLTAQATCCSVATDFCDSPWGPALRENPTRPFLGCAWQLHQSSGSGWLVLALLALLFTAFRRRRYSLLSGPLVLVPSPAPVSQFHVDATIHGSFWASATDGPLVAPAAGWLISAGLPVGPPETATTHVELFVEQGAFVSGETHLQLHPGFFTAGIGTELRYRRDLRTELQVGPAWSLEPLALGSARTVGIAAHLRPLGVDFRCTEHLHITLDPLALSWVHFSAASPAPSLTRIEARLWLGLSFR
jgi:hypothetical protein